MRVSELSAVVSELQGYLIDEGRAGRTPRLREVWQASSGQLYLKIGAVLILCEPRGPLARMYRIDPAQRPAAPPQPMAYQMLLRRHLKGSQVLEIAMIPGQRGVQLTLRDGRLIVALCNRAGNVFALRGSGAETSLMSRAWPPWGSQESAQQMFSGALPESLPEKALALTARFGGSEGEAWAWNEAANRYFSELAQRQQRTAITAAVKRAVKAASRRVQALEADLARAQDAERARDEGTLLAQNLHRLERGMSEVTLTAWGETGAQEVTVALRAELTPKENVEARFKRYRKYRNAVPEIEGRLETAWEREAELQALQERAAQVEDGGLESIAEALAQLAPQRRKSVAQRKRGAQHRALPWREMTGTGGRSIRVGRGARDNDTLTFKHSNGRDLWLHVKGFPGSHVVIPRPKGEKDTHPELILDAAVLAAHYSRAPAGEKVEVAITEVKHIRKPRGAPPGSVTYRGERVLYVAADPQRLRQIRERSGR